MNDLRKALNEAGLINKKDEKRFRHEERVRKKKLGREGREAEKRQQEDDQNKRKAESKAAVKAAQQEHDRQQKQRERERSAFADLKTRAVRDGGPRRFHYRDRERMLPYLAVSPEVARRLEGGELALVENPEGGARPIIVPRDVAESLRNVRPELVLHLAGR